MNIKKLSKTKTALLVLAIGLLLAAGVIVFRSKAPYHGPYADVASFASGYYNALIQKDYDTALGLLHRSPDTMFDDEFLLTGLQNSPPIYYRVNSVKKLSDGIFEVDGTGESDDELGKRQVTNYVIDYHSKRSFVIHWSDVPSELYDFGKIIGK